MPFSIKDMGLDGKTFAIKLNELINRAMISSGLSLTQEFQTKKN